MAKRTKSTDTRRDRASRGGSTAAAAASNHHGRFGGSAASGSRARRLSREPGAARRGYDSQNNEQRARVGRRAREPLWQKETQSADSPGPKTWMSAVDLVDTAVSQRAKKSPEKPGPSGRRGTRGQGGWATSTPRAGDPDYERHTAGSTRSRRRLGARLRGDEAARDRSAAHDDTVLGSRTGRRGAAGTIDERPAPSTRRRGSRPARILERA